MIRNLIIFTLVVNFILFNFAKDGILDTSFNKTGKLVLNLGKFSFVNSLQIQEDKKILLAGVIDTQFAIIRLNSNGSYDKSFGNKGRVTILSNQKSLLNCMVIQKDGKILVTGSMGDNFAIIRLNKDGSLDDKFAYKGKQIFKFGISVNVNKIALQDKKIIVAGDSYFRFINLIKVNQQGKFDPTFNDQNYGAGKILIKFNSVSSAKALAVQNDGKILLAGNIAGFFAVFRFDTNGVLDLKFGPFGLGFVPVISGTFASANAIEIQKDKKILVGGTSDSKFVIARLNADGSLDKTFNGQGFTQTKIDKKSSILSLAIQPWDNKIVVAGYSIDKLYKFILARYNVDGTLDKNFGNNGIINTDFNREYLGDAATCISIDYHQQKIVVGGYAGKKMAVARYKVLCSFTNNFLNNIIKKYN